MRSSAYFSAVLGLASSVLALPNPQQPNCGEFQTTCGGYTSCSLDDIKNLANYYIAGGTTVISVDGYTQLGGVGGCNLYGQGGCGATSSYSRDVGYGIQDLYQRCGGENDGMTTAGGNGYFGLTIQQG